MRLAPRVVAPQSREALFSVVANALQKSGNACSLNHIDVSGVKDLSGLFEDSPFQGDISQWNVSNAVSMESMFASSVFNGDISNWNISNWNMARVKNMGHMFYDSKFTGDLSRWDVAAVESMIGMFSNAVFSGDISMWNTSNVLSMANMFERHRAFSIDVSTWDVRAVQDFNRMFAYVDNPGDLRVWKMNDDAVITGIVAPGGSLACMPGPCRLHWVQLHCQEPQGWEPPAWLEHLQMMRIAFDLQAMTPMQAGGCLQSSWAARDQQAQPDVLRLPTQWMEPDR